MDMNEKNLLKAGFRDTDLQKIKCNVERYGGTFSEAIDDLANRFRILLCVVTGCVLIFVVLLVFGSESSRLSGGIALLCGAGITMASQPPLLAYKSCRYCRSHRH
ncbi:hypothetical protein ACLE1A_003692 [Cronobacter turicensis]|nr:hypothetical protein [Cronobacter turicensis]